jgi:NAD(P)H dehydrogenase (quinone)
MAKAVEQGAREAGANVRVKKTDEAKLSDLEWADGIILGSPTYFGVMSTKMKGLIDKSAELLNKLENKVGAAFTSALDTGSGAETTAMSLIMAMIEHEMVIVSAPRLGPGFSGKWGAIADDLTAVGAGVTVGTSDEKALKLDNCKELGKRVADIAKKLA